MKFVLGRRSRQQLEGVHLDLVRVVERAIEISSHDFTVIEGVRTMERQRMLLAKGFTRTLRSRHLTGHAVDLVPWAGELDWDDLLKFRQVGHAMRVAAFDLEIPLVWGARTSHGGHWRTLNDMPHFQLTRTTYPAEGETG